MKEAAEILRTAADLVGGDRAKQYGDAVALHNRIARFWNVYLAERAEPGAPLAAADVLAMMALLKIGRAQSGPVHNDNFVDAAGYVALMGAAAREVERGTEKDR